MTLISKFQSRAVRASVLSALLSASGGLFVASGALADGAPNAAGIDALNARLAADLADARTLQDRVAADNARTGAIEVADLFGKSDEEQAAEAAAAQHEQAQDSSIATLNQRVGDLEDTLRRLTGQLEVLDHRVGEFDQRIDRLRKDFDYKLCALSAQQLGASTGGGDSSAIPCNSSMQGSVAPPAPAAQADVTVNTGSIHLAPPPGVLGTLPADSGDEAPPPPGQAMDGPAMSGQVASIGTHSQFDTAMDLLAKAQYDEARGAFRSFVDTYPKDPLAPQALYWVGDIAYVQKDYPSAARAFAEGLKKYPSSQRSPESMLKLGQALLAMDQKQEGCTALAALASKYPGASKNVVNEAEAMRKAGGCHR